MATRSARKGTVDPGRRQRPEGWTAADKFAAVVETAALNEADLSVYCRRRGLYPEQLRSWRRACEQANDWDRASLGRLDKPTREDRNRIRVLV
ncbi:transposase [Halochromatium glycolicum]|uniref:transposase n=1 Tax=Halochromatium glycolicum TaxID=85075 RepID=UPI00190C528C|nr:transposase [Halochromatium glycolicum]